MVLDCESAATRQGSLAASLMLAVVIIAEYAMTVLTIVKVYHEF